LIHPLGGAIRSGRAEFARCFNARLLSSAALLASVVFGQPLAAAETPLAPTEDSGAIVETVLVSAQKRGVAENAQDVPIALTALDGASIGDLHATNLDRLTSVAPNVTLADAGTVPKYANFTIRGLGINTTIPSVEPTVGVFMDGIYLGNSSGTVLALFDVGSIEILRGPQATLFGRNTTGGAVLINTRRPGDVFAVHGRMSIESGMEEQVGISVEGPLARGLNAKIAGYYVNNAGWFKNAFDGKKFGADRSGFVRPTFTWTTPSGAFDSTLIYQHAWSNGQGAPVQNQAYASGFGINIDFPGYNQLDQDSVTLESNLHAGRGLVTNLFGYRRLHQEGADDIDGQPAPRFHAYSVTRQHQYSDELRYSARFFDRVDVTAGLFFFTQEFTYFERRVLFGGAIDSALGAILEDTNYAAFAEGDYYVTPKFALIAGGRLTREEKTAKTATFVPSTAGSLCNYALTTCNFNFPGPAFPGVPGNGRWDHFTPKLGANYQPEENILIYANWTRGLRSGGFNARNSSVVIPPGPYDPELQDAFELGFKSDWLEHRLRINGAAFYDQLKNLQREVTETDPVVGFVQVTRNTADATIKGLEAELEGVVGEGLVLNANVGYLEGRYDKIFYDLDGGGIGASDLALAIPRLTKWSYNFGATYARGLGNDYVMRLHADYGYRSRAALADNNAVFLVPVKNLTASAALTLPDGHWTFSLYGYNLLDTVTEGVIAPLPPSFGGGTFRTLNEGRVIGFEAAFSY